MFNQAVEAEFDKTHAIFWKKPQARSATAQWLHFVIGNITATITNPQFTESWKTALQKTKKNKTPYSTPAHNHAHTTIQKRTLTTPVPRLAELPPFFAPKITVLQLFTLRTFLSTLVLLYFQFFVPASERNKWINLTTSIDPSTLGHIIETPADITTTITNSLYSTRCSRQSTCESATFSSSYRQLNTCFSPISYDRTITGSPRLHNILPWIYTKKLISILISP